MHRFGMFFRCQFSVGTLTIFQISMASLWQDGYSMWITVQGLINCEVGSLILFSLRKRQENNNLKCSSYIT